MAKAPKKINKAHFDKYWELSGNTIRRKYDETGFCIFPSLFSALNHLFTYANEFPDYREALLSITFPLPLYYFLLGEKYKNQSIEELLANADTDFLAERILALLAARKLKGS